MLEGFLQLTGNTLALSSKVFAVQVGFRAFLRSSARAVFHLLHPGSGLRHISLPFALCYEATIAVLQPNIQAKERKGIDESIFGAS